MVTVDVQDGPIMLSIKKGAKKTVSHIERGLRMEKSKINISFSLQKTAKPMLEKKEMDICMYTYKKLLGFRKHIYGRTQRD